jgi:cysteinyl-tRNA synthetase
MKNKIYLYDSFSQKKKLLQNNHNNCITLYACGITPYDYAHIGHGRCFVVYDTLVRLIRFLGNEIRYCRNITDIDDKIVSKSHTLYGSGKNFLDISNNYYKAFIEDLDQLGCIRPDCEPRVTQYIPQIIEFIEKLIQKGHAYECNGNVYFEVSSYKEYGNLSRRALDEQCCGARVAVNDEKKHPFDFALWKKEDLDPLWDSPWGKGRPGWHIECSVMSYENLGKTIDIHGGGMDLLFPHHENERAQSESFTNEQFVSIWMHTAFVKINNEKMSKSLHNFITMRDFYNKFDPVIFRYYVLNNHYTSPLDFSWDDVKAFEKAYNKLIGLFNSATTIMNISYEMQQNPLISEIIELLCNDLNATAVIGIIFKHSDEIQNNKSLKDACKHILTNVLGLPLKPLQEKKHIPFVDDEIKELITLREKARTEKNFKEADRIRDLLKQKGINLQDGKL